MIGKSQGETEIPLGSAEWVLREGDNYCSELSSIP